MKIHSAESEESEEKIHSAESNKQARPLPHWHELVLNT